MRNSAAIKNISLTTALALVCLSAPPFPAAASRTLTRTEDFVVIAGAQAKALAGAETGDLRLYSCRNKTCSPVPVQVDKVDSLGRYVFPGEINAGRDGTQLDLNDEISFMASDAGGRRPSGWKPAGAVRGLEIELLDPLDQGKAWVYLFEQPGPAAPGLSDYVSYRIESDTTIIESPQFVLGYKTGRINYDQMRMLTASGVMGPDVLDRQRVGMEAQMAGNVNLPINAPESVVKADDIAVIDGPVRVILDQVVLVNIGDISLQWGTEYFLKYYRCGQNNSVTYEFPIGANALLKTILFYWGLDFTPEVIGSFYLDPHHEDPLPIADQERNGVPGDQPHFWWGLYGPRGAVLQALALDPDTGAHFTCDGRWKQYPQAVVRRGDFPGRLEIGFGCHEKVAMPAGTQYHWLNFILFPPKPTPEGLSALRNIFEHPLKVSVSGLL